MEFIDNILNRIAMYRLVIYVLGFFAALSITFSFMGKLSFTPTQLVVSMLLLITSAYAVDRILGRLFRQPTNMESALITALILFLIIQPAHTVSAGLGLLLAGAISSASKFLIAWGGKHIFNPAAFAAAVLSLTGLSAATWWIGSTVFWPFTLVLGLAVVRKIRRIPLWVAFMAVAVALQAYLFMSTIGTLDEVMKHAILASPLLFMSTIMLTEPATMPTRRSLQMVFAALVAVLYIEAWRVGPLIIYPEVALLIGNLFAFAVSPKFRTRMVVKEVQRISDRVRNYVLVPDRQFAFVPGQYMEWTLADVPYDSRGNRRTFTIASSPTEDTVQLGMKFYEPASQYKAEFDRMQPGNEVFASQLAGNFTIRGKEQKKLAFVAGGIGITPFRSMIKYLTDRQIRADAVLFYAVGNPEEFAYLEDFQSAAAVGVRTIPVVANQAFHSDAYLTADLDAELIARYAPDFKDRLFYISGPNVMVDKTIHQLRGLGVPRRRIRTDHFSGY